MNIPGWRTNQKIVVFESDDWGSIRMPSKITYLKLLQLGIRADNCPFLKYDSLASEDDLNALIETLKLFKDYRNKYPVFTLNTIVANPDFRKIQQSHFRKYSFELFTKTLENYPKHSKSFHLWQQGINENVLYPQLHGREHLQINRWLKMLQSKSRESIIAFEHELFGISTTITKELRESYMAAFDADSVAEIKLQKHILKDAKLIFDEIFNYSSSSFIAPNYIWDKNIEHHLSTLGIKFIQGLSKQQLPQFTQKKRTTIRHYLGEKNNHGQFHLVRNCFFEPTVHPTKDVVSNCLKQIQTAFLWRKPAIICSHRLNYIGFIDEGNRVSSLTKLKELLSKILKHWPDAIFLNSEELGMLIEKDKL